MDSCFPDWNTDVGAEFPLPDHRNPLGSEDELVELLWQDGEVVLNTQTNNRKLSKQAHKHFHDYETVSWADCPIDEAFEKEFYANLLSEIPPPNPVDHDLQPPVKRRAVDQCSVRTVDSSHCASNQVANRDLDMSWVSSSYGVCGGSKAVSPVVEKKHLSPSYRSTTDKETGGSGSSGFWNQSHETGSRKRKARYVEESECRSDATKLESAAGNKSFQKPGMSRKSRVAEVHNMSERRRRDRINERMRALQELIPHSNKSDKASMLDEAIEYMKSLQWQLQIMWMGSGMAPMMVPGMQHYMPRFGMGTSPPMLPAITMAPRVNQALVNYHNQLQNYMGFFPSLPNASQQINMFNYGFHPPQQNMALNPPGNGNRPHGS